MTSVGAIGHFRRGTVAEAGNGEASKDWLLSVLPWFDHVDGLWRYSLPMSCLLKLKIEWNVKTFFSPPQQLTKKVNNIETGWALGATFHLLQSLGLSHWGQALTLRPAFANNLFKGRREDSVVFWGSLGTAWIEIQRLASSRGRSFCRQVLL